MSCDCNLAVAAASPRGSLLSDRHLLLCQQHQKHLILLSFHTGDQDGSVHDIKWTVGDARPLFPPNPEHLFLKSFLFLWHYFRLKNDLIECYDNMMDEEHCSGLLLFRGLAGSELNHDWLWCGLVPLKSDQIN